MAVHIAGAVGIVTLMLGLATRLTGRGVKPFGAGAIIQPESEPEIKPLPPCRPVPMGVDVTYLNGERWRYIGWGIREGGGHLVVTGRGPSHMDLINIPLVSVRMWEHTRIEEPNSDWVGDTLSLRLDSESTAVVDSVDGTERPDSQGEDRD